MKMLKENCPKCQCPRINKAEYCVCGYKYLNMLEQAFDMIKEMGLDPKETK